MTEPVPLDPAASAPASASSSLANNESTVQITQRQAKPVSAPEPAHESLRQDPAAPPSPAPAPAPVTEPAALPEPAALAPATVEPPAPVPEVAAAPVFYAPEVQETPQLSIPERMNLLQSTQQTVNNQLDALEAALKKKPV